MKSQRSRCKTPAADWLCVVNMNALGRFDISLLHILEHSSRVDVMDFSPDAQVIATVCEASVYIFDLKTGAKLNTLSQDKFFTRNERISSICFSPDAKYIATGNDGGGINIWSMPEQKLCFEFIDHRDQVLAVRFSQDGNAVASMSSKAIRIHDITLNRMVYATNVKMPFHLSRDAMSGFAISPNWKFFAIYSRSGYNIGVTLKVWEAETEIVVLEKELSDSSYGQLSFSPTSDEIIYASPQFGVWRSNIGVVDTISNSKSSAVVDPADPKPHVQVPPSIPLPHYFALSSDGAWMISADSGVVNLWSTAGEHELILWGPEQKSVLTSNMASHTSSPACVISH